MAFLKYAKAAVVKPQVSAADWDGIRQAALSPAPDFQHRTAKVLLQEYDPKRFMLSHCTIIASVDTEAVAEPMGKSMVDGFQIDRRYADYHLTPGTAKYVNNNNDAWERKLLLSCFKTFIGGENYVEHIQIPEMSKGKILDAAARNIGDSVYIDILVATDRKHAPLIKAITSGQLGTLSMGCFVAGTQVTMADGTRLPIEEVAPGDMVVTHKGRVREVLNKQIRIGSWGVRRIKAVGVPSAIVTTDIHPFFVYRAAKTCACGCGESLSSSDKDPVRRMSKRFRRGHDKRLCNPNGSYSLAEARKRKSQISEIQKYTLEEVRADELQVGDYACFPKSALQEIEGAEGATEGKARLLGYFLAEGSFLKHKGKRVEAQFNFSMSEKETFAQEVVDLLVTEFPEANTPWIQERPERDTCVVHVTGTGVADWFFEHGGEYSHLKKLAPSVMAWPAVFQKQLISTWLDGDGTVHSQKSLSGTTTSYALACQLHLLLARCGIFSRMECSFGGHSVEVQEAVNGGVSLRHSETGRLAAFTLVISAQCVFPLQPHSLKAQSAGSPKNRHLREIGDMLVFPITSVESERYEGPVYDMEVEEDHSYIVEGLAVHNCSVDFTICSKCGNVAADETNLCPHIRYFKGSEFIDSMGQTRKIAELCGHIDAEPGSVKFIEASWVANPAFTGAVLRNILSPEEIAGLGQKMHMALKQPPRVADPTMMAKAARSLFTQEQELPDIGEEPSEGETAPQKDGDDDPLEKVVDDLVTNVKDKVIEKLRKQINEGEAAKVQEVLDENSSNESLIKSALRHPEWQRVAKFVKVKVGTTNAKKVLLGLILHKKGGWKAIRAANCFSGFDILAVSRVLDMMTKRSSMAGEARVYRTVMSVGGTAPYVDAETYLAACRQALGRNYTGSEAAVLLEKGRLFSLGL